MPATVVGSQISWGLYLFAAVGLLLAVTPTLQSASSASADAAALGVLGGLKSAFDNLRPGETAVLDLSASGVAGRVVLSGQTLTWASGSTSLTVMADRGMVSATLYLPGTFEASIQQGRVVVTRIV